MQPNPGDQLTYKLWTDGGARGNPGPAGIGAVLLSPTGEVEAELSAGIGRATNNEAEYRALIAGLQMARDRGVGELEVNMDSTLVVQQLKGVFRVKHPGLKPLFEQAKALKSDFDRIVFRAVPRSQNAAADKLVNAGIDKWLMEYGDSQEGSISRADFTGRLDL